MISFDFFLRDEKGNLMYAQGINIEDTTNTVAEAKATLAASNHCKCTQYNKAIFQTDSMLIRKVLEGGGHVHGASQISYMR